MNAQHTPGPWAMEDGNGEHLAGPKGGFVPVGGCGCCGSPFMAAERHDVGLADARLLAAAPDLLFVLEGVMKAEKDEAGRIILFGWQQEVIRAEIAKATGVES